MRKKKIDKKGLIFLILFLIIGFSIISLHYFRNYQIRTSVPSSLYSKELKIDSGLIKGYPAFISSEDGYIASYTINNKVILNKIDKIGKKNKTVSINGYSEYVNNINLVHGKNSYFLVFTTYIDGNKKVVEYSFDKNLNKISEVTGTNINNVIKIDDNSLLYTYDNKVIYKNFIEGSLISLNYKGIKMAAGTKTGNTYYIMLMDLDGATKEIAIENGKAVEKNSYLINRTSSMSFKNIAAAADNKNMYSLIEIDLKGETKGVNLLTIPKNGGNITYKAFTIGNNKLFYNLLSVSSGSDAKFIGITNVSLPGGRYAEELVEFSIKDGMGSSINKATRLDKIPYSPSYSGDSMVFFTNEGDDISSLYITSKNERFKEANNAITSQEKSIAATDTISGILTSISFIFVLGITWIFFGVILVGIITFLEFKKENIKTDILLLIGYVMTGLFKTYMIYNTVYVRFAGSVTGFLSNAVIGCLASILISFVCSTFLIYMHKKDEDGMAFFIFFIPLIIDTVLTQLLFVPFL